MRNPYHVRLAISQYGDRYRSELFTEDLGDTSGDLLPVQWRVLDDDFKSYLSMGAASLPPDTAAKVGQEIFNHLLGKGENQAKWKEVTEQAKRQDRPIRLLIDATTEDVRDLPYGLLCDPHDDFYLFRQPEIQFVRIIRRCTPRLLNLNKNRLRMLLIAAQPTQLHSFEAAKRVCELAQKIPDKIDLYAAADDRLQLIREVSPETRDSWVPDLFEAVCQNTRNNVKKILETEEFDILHFLCHGFSGGILLCDSNGGRAEVTARELGTWCGARQHQMAFLQVCRAGSTSDRGSFGGVAQQLLNPKYGNMGAVVASAYPVDAELSQEAVLKFYEGIANGEPPDMALERQLPETNWSWAFLELWVRPSALADTGSRGAFQFASPYKGLARFEERDAEIFFGRESETAELTNILESESIVAIVGDSGSGKSSLVHAGLTPLVRHNGLVGQKNWHIVSLVPGNQPATNLLSALNGIEQTDENQPPTNWSVALRQALMSTCDAHGRLLVLINQFEEIFTLCNDEAQRNAIAEALAHIAEKRKDQFRLVMDMRSEFGSRAVALPGLTEIVKRPWVLKPPRPENIRDIVEKPATHHSYSFQGPIADRDPKHNQNLLDRILDDPLLANKSDAPYGEDLSGVSPTPLPLLEFALERLWLTAVGRGSQEFTHEDYDQLGGLSGAIAQHADDVYNSLSSRPEFEQTNDPQPIVEKILTGLVSLRSKVATRRPRVRRDLEVETGNADVARDVIDCLVGERLLEIRSEGGNLVESRVNISHEVLIRWPKFQSWLGEDAETRILKEEFQNDVERWESGSGNRPPRSRWNLPSIKTQNDYLAWIDIGKPSLTDSQRDFAAVMRIAVRRNGILKLGIFSSSLVGLIVMAALAVWANIAHQETIRQLVRVNIVSGVAARDQNIQQIKAAHLLTNAAVLSTDPVTSKNCQLSADLLVRQATLSAIFEHSDSVNGTLFDKKRNRILTWSADCSLKLWDATTGTPVETPMMRHEKPIIGASYSLDGKSILSWSHDGTLRLWNAENGQKSSNPMKHKRVQGARFYESGARILSWGLDGKLRLWETGSTAEASTSTLDHGSAVQGATINHAETKILSWSDDGSLLQWDLATVEKLEPRMTHEKGVNGASYSSDDSRILSWGKDHLIKVWDADNTTADQAKVMRHNAAVNGATFFHNDLRIVSWADDKTARTWNIENPEMPLTEMRHDAWEVYGAQLIEGGHLILTWGEDGTARLWDATRASEEGIMRHDGSVVGANFIDENQIVTWSHDGSVRIWQIASEMYLKSTFRHNGQVVGATLLPSGLVTWSQDGSARLWMMSTDGSIQLEHQEIKGTEFNTDRSRFLTWDHGGEVRLWDSKTGTQIEPTFLHAEEVNGATFAANSNQVLSWSNDGKVCIWNPGDATSEISNDFNSPVLGAVFDMSETGILSWCRDGTISRWNAQTKKPMMPDAKHAGVTNVLFDTSNRHFVSWGNPGNLKVWLLPETVRPAAEREYDGGVGDAIFSSDSTKLLSCGWNADAEIWNIQTNERIAHVQHKRELIGATFNSIETHVLSWCRGGEVKFWNAKTGKTSAEYRHKDEVKGALLFKSDQCALSWSIDTTLLLWNLKQNVAIATLNHGGVVEGAALNDDESIICSWSQDSAVKLWDAQTGDLITTMLHGDSVMGAAWAENDLGVLSWTVDGKLRMWDLKIDDLPREHLMLRLEVQTGTRLNNAGQVEALTKQQWKNKKARFDKVSLSRQ